MEEPYRVLEFYSGIGGMRYSLVEAGIRGEVVEAFDINEVANDVYEHNFGHRPFQGNISKLTAADLDKYMAHAWLLSPPCQPYTRQGLQKDSDDARASSFIKLVDLMQHMRRPPLMLFVENVVGFEVSKTHTHLMEALRRLRFITQEFILSPVQFEVPYSRPRYFCLAKKECLSFQNPSFNGQLVMTPPFQSLENELSVEKACRPIRDFLEDLSEQFGDDDVSVPPGLIERWGIAMDIVYPESKRCCCFTKSYYRYVKGTGSLLATSKVLEEQPPEVFSLMNLGLRFFTPREVANLHSLPQCFSFPDHVTIKQRYALLGNGLSVVVVASLLQHLFSEPH